MRALVATVMLAAVALLAGCTATPAYQENVFTSPLFTNYSDVASEENRWPPPYVLTYPDETMFFYRIWPYHPRADLIVRAISCSRTSDGALVVSARVQNMGSDIVPSVPNLNGDKASFRIAAVVTWADGTQQEVDAWVPVTLWVTASVDQKLSRTRYLFNDVRRIVVVADPDRIVPDPVRLNNVLVWQGTMSGDNPSCDVVRS
ncbi:MAG TPA: hypothetical protein VEN29_02200 [Casimicrobiaceae bacterium]|nr:hypothetical protein [Casimicrobiaceae bacterium]